MERTITPRRLYVPARSSAVWLWTQVAGIPLRRPPVWLLVAVGVATFTRPINPAPVNTVGYDYSWTAAMHVAAHMGLHWGRQIEYTYTNPTIFSVSPK